MNTWFSLCEVQFHSLPGKAKKILFSDVNFICPFFADCEAWTGRDRRWSARQPHLRADRREVPRRVRTQGQGQAQLSISQGQARLFKQITFITFKCSIYKAPTYCTIPGSVYEPSAIFDKPESIVLDAFLAEYTWYLVVLPRVNLRFPPGWLISLVIVIASLAVNSFCSICTYVGEYVHGTSMLQYFTAYLKIPHYSQPPSFQLLCFKN